MDSCQPQKAIEQGRKAPEINGKEANPEESHDDNVCEEEGSPDSSSRSSDEVLNGKKKYVPTPPSRKKSRVQDDSLLTEVKVTINKLKSLALDTSS